MTDKKYWRSLEEYKSQSTDDSPQSTDNNSQSNIDSGLSTNNAFSRRDFLKASGFGLAAAAFAFYGCESAINKAIPYLIKPEGIIPGAGEYYASTFYDGHDYCSILVKTREGRPIKIESNSLSKLTPTGTNARVQASVLSLYDDNRLKHPLKQATGKRQKALENTTWEIADKEIGDKLTELSNNKEKIVILTSSIISPATKGVISDFIQAYPTTEVITYDAISVSGILEANKTCFDKEVLPSYRFDKADLIVSFGADFLGTWIAPIEYSGQYASRKTISKENTNICKHIQFESTLSLTGSNADTRISMNPSEEWKILLKLYNKLVSGFKSQVSSQTISSVEIDKLAEELITNKGKALLISGSNNVNIQILVNKINHLIGSYGTTIDLDNPVYYKQGVDNKMYELVDRLNKGEVKGLILYNVNPAYDYPQADKFIKGLAKTQLSVSFAESLDETAKLTNYVCPDNHYLESWNDAEPRKDSFSFCQPAINRLFDTRQAQDSLLIWSGQQPATGDQPAVFYNYLKSYWEANMFPKQTEYKTFQDFWTNNVQKGVFELKSPQSSDHSPQGSFILSDTELKKVITATSSEKANGIEYVVYENIGIGTGKQANNPWLQELPDPISKVCWDNYLAISLAMANKLNLKLGDIVKINNDKNNSIELPILIQPGQADNTVSVALGYGRTSTGIVAKGVGKNAYPFINSNQQSAISYQRIYSGDNITIKPTGVNYIFALTQTHHTMEGRPLIREGNLSEYKTNPSAGNEKHLEDEKKDVKIYPKREFKGHHWGLVIDLNKCTGCSACVIACQAENNVPVVGKEEVRKRRIMHWIRVDRYYSENPVTPEVHFQPVFCQHCNNAPCENVCPVEATQNSKEGLNEMAYNRCVGTKYCVNNCPYHVRRFNWLAYNGNDLISTVHYDQSASDLSRMQFNPDVIVRSRGVVEKCSLCIQRIQEIKLLAKRENREIADGEIKPACLQCCPSGAMIFGDQNNPESRVSKALEDERRYFLLEQLNTVPAVGFLTKIKNDS